MLLMLLQKTKGSWEEVEDKKFINIKTETEMIEYINQMRKEQILSDRLAKVLIPSLIEPMTRDSK